MIVVAGVTGRTGKVVAQTLLGRGRRVRVMVREAAQGRAWHERGAEVAVASLDDPPALVQALDGATGFYALLPENPAASYFHARRRCMAGAMADAVRASRVPDVVLLSATAAAMADGNGPAKDLHIAEQSLRAAGCRLTVVRAGYFQENVVAFVPAALQDGIFPNFLPSADAQLATVATRDVGACVAQCLMQPPPAGETIDLQGPTYTVRQMVDRLGCALGRTLRIVDVPAAAQADALVGAGLPRQYATALAELYGCFASGRVTPQGDRMMFGHTTLDETLRDAIPRRRPA